MNDNLPRAFLPNFCAIRMVFAVVVSSEFLAIVLTLGAFPPSDAFWGVLSLRSLYIQWITLSVAALYCLLRAPLGRLSHAVAGILAWLLVLLATLCVFLAAHALGLRGSSPLMPALAHHLAIAGIVGAVLLRYLYEQHRERERELAESQARLQALQARIRPHFLFNSMNTIASLTRVDPDLAEQVVEDLSDLFRATLSDADTLSTLEREFELAHGYLRIEQQRLGGRLRVTWDVPDLPLDAPMPGLLLQPLLENAVYHGIEPSTAGGEVVISGRCREGVISLAVRNTLPDGESQRARRGNRMAQRNVRERLDAAFGEDAGMVVGRVDDCYQVRLHFPVGRR
ncbi:MAG: sensor histidine kinase [Chromatiaceae bacterium]|nr:sensor histidine kinase [Gammaproteobacteria bacterium]MCP5300475.1 sensor histidine kinase [Chromatiaceae bacterium]MCP5422547.1 sensor histidine kinase [Chromatiaceae bacterium]